MSEPGPGSRRGHRQSEPLEPPGNPESDDTPNAPTAVDELWARLDDLSRRVDATESVLALQALKARYGEVVDARFERGRPVDDGRMTEVAAAAAALFTEGGRWDGGPALGVAVGREAIAARLSAPTLVFSRHLFVKPRIEVSGDRATGRWELLCPCTDAEGTPLWMCGYEDDTYERVAGTWLHASMRLTTSFVAPVGEGWSKILS